MSLPWEMFKINNFKIYALIIIIILMVIFISCAGFFLDNGIHASYSNEISKNELDGNLKNYVALIKLSSSMISKKIILCRL